MMVLIRPVLRSMLSGGEASPRVGGKRHGGSTVLSSPLSRAHTSMVSRSLFILRSDKAHMLWSEPANSALPEATPASRPVRVTPLSVSALSRAVGCAGELKGRHPSSSANIVDFVISLIEHSGSIQPPLNVLAPVNTGSPNVLANGEGHRPTRALDLVSNLEAACRCTHDQNASVRELVRIAVMLCR